MKFSNLDFNPAESTWEETPDGFLRVKSRVLAQRVMPYGAHELEGAIPPEMAKDGKVRMLVRKEQMASPEAIRSLEGAPLVLGDHQWLTPEEIKKYSVGNVAGTPKLDGDYLLCDFLFTDPEAISEMKKRKKEGNIPEVSAAYTADPVFEKNNLDGQEYDAEQTNLLYNHIAILTNGKGRAGQDVRVLNKDGSEEIIDPEEKIQETNEKITNKKEVVKMARKIKLLNSEAVINVEDDEMADSIENEQTLSSDKLETTMNELETAKGEKETLEARISELEGELSVYKEKLDALISEEAVEHAAMEMNAEQADADEIVENAEFLKENGEEDEEKKTEIQNSVKKLYGTKMKTFVLNSIGVNTEGMTADGINGAFKAQRQIVDRMKANNSILAEKKKVAGATMVKNLREQIKNAQADATPRQDHLRRLGYPVEKK